MLAYRHHPVMLSEVTEVLSQVPDGVLLDATVGGGGHVSALLEEHPGLRLVGIDRDQSALREAENRLAAFRGRVALHHARFDDLDAVLDSLGHSLISAALFDLGVSSAQLEESGRGFSYHLDGPLDMRMDRTALATAADIVNRADEHTLASILRDNSDERYARRIARSIAAERPFSTTVELAETIRHSVPAAARRNGHPARRAFQALRIEVNSELKVLTPALESALQRLTPGGRCAVLSYHSGEDRIVKTVFRQSAGVLPLPPGLPQAARPPASVRLLWKGIKTPRQTEVEANRRASSARLRGVERLSGES